MPHLSTDDQTTTRHCDDIQDIIASPPSWLLKWGISLFFTIVVLIIGLSAFINYPDIIKTQLKITSVNMPKLIVAKMPGRIIALLVRNDQQVINGQALAYLESTANHENVLTLLNRLHVIQQNIQGDPAISSSYFSKDRYVLGELQAAYQNFYQEFITYQAAINNGTWIRKKNFLKLDLINISKQKLQLSKQKQLQQRDRDIAVDEFEMNKKLLKEKAETPAEFRDAESKYLSKESPLLQTEAALITSEENYSAKQKEILELDNQVQEERTKFVQALNTLISQADEWRNKYILTAPQNGKVSFVGIIQKNSVLQAGQEILSINPGNENYFGEMAIPQYNLGKVKTKQEVLIKLKSYPFEEYGIIHGQVNSINDVPYKDSVFFSNVSISKGALAKLKRPIHLKQGMLADAEIITENATMLQRLTRNFTKLMGR